MNKIALAPLTIILIIIGVLIVGGVTYSIKSIFDGVENNEVSERYYSEDKAIFCERENPPYYRYFKFIFVNNISGFSEDYDDTRKTEVWIMETKNERKSYTEDSEVTSVGKLYYHRYLEIYDKETGFGEIYSITFDYSRYSYICKKGT
jgi:hypothetical protein